MSAFFYLQVSDTIPAPEQLEEVPPFGGEDSAVGYFPFPEVELLRIELPRAKPRTEEIKIPEPVNPVLINPPVWNFGENFFVENNLNAVVSASKTTGAENHQSYSRVAEKPEFIAIQQRNPQSYDWMLGVFLLLTLFFIWIRIFYGKFFSTLGGALTSYQMAAKLFREKNVLQRRVSIVLDFIYLVVLSVFIFELASHFSMPETRLSSFNLFMLFLNFVMLYALLRVFVLRGTGYLFLNHSLFSEYIHNTFIVNKGTGIALFPVVIIAHYIDPKLAQAVLVLGIVIFTGAFILKVIRAYQIIMRKDVFLFYMILYLCTLEILPLLLGYKAIISLI